MSDNTTGSLDYIRRMRIIEYEGYKNSLSGCYCYGKPLTKWDLFKRKIRNLLRK